MGVEPKIGGKPPKWMVKIMENPIKLDDLGGKKKTIFGSTPTCTWYLLAVPRTVGDGLDDPMPIFPRTLQLTAGT